jgi:hypothetical protein
VFITYPYRGHPGFMISFQAFKIIIFIVIIYNWPYILFTQTKSLCAGAVTLDQYGPELNSTAISNIHLHVAYSTYG